MNPIFKSLEKKTNVYVVRHAESEYNVLDLVAGRFETPLTPTGESQAIETGKFLADKEISIILYSPLQRTLQTAQYISDQFSNNTIPLLSYNSLIEMDGGVFTHKNIANIAEEEPETYRHFKIHSWEGVEGAETIGSLLARCQESWSAIADYANNGHRNILVVSHGGYMQWLFKTSLGFSGNHVESWAPIVRTSNCGIFKLVIEPISQTAESGAHAIWELLNHICYN